MRTRSKWLLAAATVLSTLLLPAAPVLAHEGRTLGDLELEVGFGTEPAYAGLLNGVQLIVVHDGEPVLDVADTLEVEVAFGDQTTQLRLEPFFEEGGPGEYRGWFIPSATGQYSFHFTGTIDGEEIDETFTSGPDTFSDVEDPASVTFPEVVAPTTTELAELIGRVEPRLASRIDDALARADEVADDASNARTLGMIGLVVGVLGLAVAAVALVASRKRA